MYISFLDRSDGSLHQKALRSGFWVSLSSIVVIGLSFLRSVLLARILTPDVFGLMAICSMVTRGIEIFTETGFGAALVHRQARFEDARDTAFTLWVLRGAVLSIIAFLVAPSVADFYDEQILGAVVAVAGMSFMLTGFHNVNMIALQKELDFKRLAYLEQIAAVFNTIAAVVLAYALKSIWALVYSQLLSSVISVTLSYLVVPGRPRFRFDAGIAKELLCYGKYMTGLAIVVFLSNQLDNAMIGKLLGMESLGYYTVAYTLANIPSTNLSKIIARVYFPMFSKLQADPEQLRVEYSRGIYLVTSLVVPISVAIVVLAHEIIAVLYGNKWATAAVPLQVLAVFGCLQALWMLNGYLYNAIGKPYLDFYMNALRFVLVSGLLYPLTVSYGLVGSSLAITLPMATQFIAGLYLSWKVIGAPIWTTLRQLIAATAQGAVLAILLIGAKSLIAADSFPVLILLFLLGASVCVVFHLREIRIQLSSSKSSFFSMREAP
jgi:O-antigen/teichoic acid export membrane protein